MTAISLARHQGEAVRARLERFGQRHPESRAALVVGAAWTVLVALHGPGSTDHPRAGDGLVHAGAGWLVMVVAMMVPSTFPVVRHVAGNSLWHRRHRSVALLLGAFVAVWTAFGLVVIPVTGAVQALLGMGDHLLAASLLGLAAAWELTSVKQRSLRACHRTVPLPPLGRKADLACARFGVRHARACVIGCWPLMLAMAAAGHANLALMITLTPVVVAEKLATSASRAVRPAAVALAAAALILLAAGA